MSSHDLAYELAEQPEHCERCLTAPTVGLLRLHTEDGHNIAAWWTCGPCADHDAPIHTARGMTVAVVVPDCSW